jgi:hypothetical protein
MLVSIALCLLASTPAAAPRTSVASAGFVRDARVELRANNHLAFDARIQWPATITRRSFVVEGLAADGAVLFTRAVTASAPTPAGHHLRTVQARFDVELPSLDGVQEVRVRLAQ